MIQPGNSLVETSEVRYRLITENAPDLISLLDLNDEQRYIYAGPSYRTVLGYYPSALIGACGDSLVHPDDRAFVREQQALLSTCAVAQATFRCRHLDGSWRWIETRWTSIGQQGASYVLAIGRDVTECKNLEMRLSQIQKLDDIEHLAGRAAHDFNNVLTGISGYVELVQSSLPPDSPARADLEEIRRSTVRAARLAEELLAFVRSLAPKGI